MANNNSRWTDNPFRQPGLTPEQLAWLDKRDEATRIYLETGDDTMAIEIGLFPPHDDEDSEDGGIDSVNATIKPVSEKLSGHDG